MTDLPAILFAEDLLLAYPEAKVILNHRDVDDWYISMSRTILTVLSWRFIGPAKPTYGFFRQACNIAFGNDWNPDAVKASYLMHYQQIRNLVPEDQLLEVSLGDGWKPMCAFLDVPVPSGSYPTAYNTHEFLAFHKKEWWSSLFVQVFYWVGGTGFAILLLAVGLTATILTS